MNWEPESSSSSSSSSSFKPVQPTDESRCAGVRQITAQGDSILNQQQQQQQQQQLWLVIAEHRRLSLAQEAVYQSETLYFIENGDEDGWEDT